MVTVLSKNLYDRKKAEDLLRSRLWFKNTNQKIQRQILDLPERSNGFINDLADRPEKFGDFEIIRMNIFTYAKPFAFCSFEVKSNFTGEIYQIVVNSWDKGMFHSLRGIILLESNGKISHFVLRNVQRFSASKEMSESLGSIYPPENFRSGNKLPVVYLENKIQEMMRLPKIKIEKCFDLGQIYPDPGMSDNIVSLYAAVIKIKSPEEFESYIKDKKYDDRNYTFSFSMRPVEELLNFLSQTQDSFLLAIFGRLQALNIINL